MRRLSMLAALCLVAVVVFAPAALAQGQNVTVSMEDNYFEQPNITVEPGTTVTWVQTGQNPHTTTSYDGLWDSGMIEGGSGGTFSFTFEEPGTYAYYCIPHEDQGMTGTVTVTGGGAAGDSASGGAQQGQLADTGGPPLIVLSGTLALALCGLAALVLLRRRRAS